MTVTWGLLFVCHFIVEVQLINIILKNNFNYGSEKKSWRSENNNYLSNCNKVLFISRVNSRNFIYRATAGSEINKISRVYEWNKGLYYSSIRCFIPRGWVNWWGTAWILLKIYKRNHKYEESRNFYFILHHQRGDPWMV